MSGPAALLEALAEEEMRLVASRRLDALPELYARRGEALAALPPVHTGEERAMLERALAMQVAVRELLERLRDDVAGELARIGRGRTAAAGYAAAAATRPGPLKPR